MTASCTALLSAETARHGGTVIKTIGDGMMITFPTASDAAQAACAMHRALERHNATEGTSIHIRIGINYGPALREANNDVFGDVVNVAARMEALAGANQIFLTESAYAALTADLRQSSRPVGRFPVKGKQDEIGVYEVLWKQTEDLTIVSPALADALIPAASLSIHFQNQEIVLSKSRPRLTIGRSRDSDIVVTEESVSRTHATIEYRGGKFILIDRSINGTYISTADGSTAHLRREEFPLQGSGFIFPGRKEAEPIRFTLRG
jgi:adenylate cyclase